MVNIDPDNGIAYGYIAAAALDYDMVDALMYNTDPSTVDHTFEDFFQSELAIARRFLEEQGSLHTLNMDVLRDRLWDEWNCEEPIIEGFVKVSDGEVHYRSSWMGGALHFFILKSPYITARARRASPCVPNAGILDTLDGDVTAYDVPADWRAEA